MALDVPTFETLFDAGEREALLLPTAFNPDIIRLDGSDVNVAMAVMAGMAEEVARYCQQTYNSLFLSTTAKIGGDTLYRFVRDRYGLTPRLAQRAVGTVTFTRTTNVGFTIPADYTVTATDGTVFKTVNAVPFPPNQVGSLSVLVVAEQAGTDGNVAANTITGLSTPLDDTTTSVTNAEPAAGGTLDETDEELAERARQFFPTLRRGTRNAIQAGGLATPGVSQATVVEQLDGAGDPVYRVQLIIADPNGQANVALAARTREVLEEYRALGVPVLVTSGTPEFISIVVTGLQFEANTNTTNVLEEARGRIVASVNATPPSITLRLATITSALTATTGLIVPEGAVTTPAGDLVPQSGGVIRTSTDRISLNGQ